MNLLPLPPGVRATTFTYSDGRTVTVYRAPFASEGPVTEGRVLFYMYAHYVFRWPAEATTLDVGHGTIAAHMPLWQDVPIAGRWCPRTLVDFARRWVRDQFRRVAGQPTGHHAS